MTQFLLLIVSLLVLAQGGGCFLLYGQTPRPKVTCITSNHPVVTVHRSEDGKTGKEVEEDDWWVSCKITRGEEIIYEKPLALAHPTSFRESMEAIEEFRTKKAPELIKENAKEKK